MSMCAATSDLNRYLRQQEKNESMHDAIESLQSEMTFEFLLGNLASGDKEEIIAEIASTPDFAIALQNVFKNVSSDADTLKMMAWDLFMCCHARANSYFENAAAIEVELQSAGEL